MRNVILFTTLFLYSLSTFANLEVGIYEGTFINGSGDSAVEEKCLIGINEINFVNEIRHPLNERVNAEVSFSQTSFSFSHLPVIDVDASSIKPEKSIMKAAQASEAYVEAVVLTLVHSDNYSGPTSFTYISDNNVDTKIKKVCSNLKKM
jgi:hypothetical protein